MATRAIFNGGGLRLRPRALYRGILMLLYSQSPRPRPAKGGKQGYHFNNALMSYWHGQEKKWQATRADLVENFSNFQPSHGEATRHALSFREKKQFFRLLALLYICVSRLRPQREQPFQGWPLAGLRGRPGTVA